jgi:hypothetical protein
MERHVCMLILRRWTRSQSFAIVKLLEQRMQRMQRMRRINLIWSGWYIALSLMVFWRRLHRTLDLDLLFRNG